jgi:large subunit ribosomal protein L17
MRHGKKVNHLGRTKSHRDALLSNMANSLIKAKRIQTTLAKAKALRMFIEPLITKGKEDSTHSRRVVFSYLQDKESINLLFGEIAEKVAERNGGYTRIIKLGQRQGDSADVALIELVDYNENMQTSVSVEEEAKGKRSRRGKSKKVADGSVNAVSGDASDVVATPLVEDGSFAEVVEEAAEVVEEVPEIVSTPEVVEDVVESSVAPEAIVETSEIGDSNESAEDAEGDVSPSEDKPKEDN